MHKISQRNSCIRFLYAQQDLQTLEGCYLLVKEAISMIQAEKDIIQLALATQELNIQQKHYETVNSCISNEEGKQFWINHVGAHKTQEPVYNFAQKFFQVEFSKLDKDQKEKIKKQYAVAQLLLHLDQNGTGTVDLEETDHFYEHHWGSPKHKKSLVDKVLQDQEQPLHNHTQIMGSILEECGLQRLITQFVAHKLDSRSFLHLDLSALMKLTTNESAIKINDAIQNYKREKQKFHDIRDFLRQTRPQAFEVLRIYLQNPQPWKERLTGVCKISLPYHCGDMVVYSVNGILVGPYGIIHDDIFDWCPMYGYCVHLDPTKEKKARNYYEGVVAPQLDHLYKQHKIEYYIYYNKDQVWSMNVRDPDNKSYSRDKQYLRYDDKYNGDTINHKHSPTILEDENGNEVRIYYYQDQEVSYEDYIKYTSTNAMIRNDIKSLEYEQLTS